MLSKVPSDIIRSYAGELRIKDDERESQVLFEYDMLFEALMKAGVQHNLELPPLFLKPFIDHRCVTGMYR